VNPTQRIAQDAAQRLREGRATDIADAIRGAVGHLRLHDANLPSHALVRQITQAIMQSEMGSDAYAESVRARDVQLVAVMELLASALGAHVTVAGRAARGEFDADPRAHLRVVSDQRIGAAAAALVGAGWDEPEFTTLNTTFGRCDQLHSRKAGLALTLTRIPSALAHHADDAHDMVTGKPTMVATAAQVRSRAEIT
jgi:hypothetical protein